MSGAISATSVAAGLTTAAGTAAVTGAGVAEAAGLIGAGVSAVGAIQQGNAAKAAAGYNAAVATQNATIATQNAATASAIGNENAGIQGMKNKAAIGGQLAAQGANGVDVNSGSAVDVRIGQEESGQLSSQTIRSNAARQAYGFQTNAASDTGQAVEDTYSGNQAAISGDISAGADVLKGGGTTAQYGLGAAPNSAGVNYQAQQSQNYLYG